jgi:hypothetical protein
LCGESDRITGLKNVFFGISCSVTFPTPNIANDDS